MFIVVCYLALLVLPVYRKAKKDVFGGGVGRRDSSELILPTVLPVHHQTKKVQLLFFVLLYIALLMLMSVSMWLFRPGTPPSLCLSFCLVNVVQSRLLGAASLPSDLERLFISPCQSVFIVSPCQCRSVVRPGKICLLFCLVIK